MHFTPCSNSITRGLSIKTVSPVKKRVLNIKPKRVSEPLYEDRIYVITARCEIKQSIGIVRILCRCVLHNKFPEQRMLIFFTRNLSFINSSNWAARYMAKGRVTAAVRIAPRDTKMCYICTASVHVYVTKLSGVMQSSVYLKIQIYWHRNTEMFVYCYGKTTILYIDMRVDRDNDNLSFLPINIII